MTSAGVRIGKITMKSGCVVVPMPSPDDRMRKLILATVRECLHTHEDGDCRLAGYAFVIWDHDGASTARFQPGGMVPSMTMPDFVRNRLLAARIESWTIQTINEQ